MSGPLPVPRGTRELPGQVDASPLTEADEPGIPNLTGTAAGKDLPRGRIPAGSRSFAHPAGTRRGTPLTLLFHVEHTNSLVRTLEPRRCGGWAGSRQPTGRRPRRAPTELGTASVTPAGTRPRSPAPFARNLDHPRAPGLCTLPAGDDVAGEDALVGTQQDLPQGASPVAPGTRPQGPPTIAAATNATALDADP